MLPRILSRVVGWAKAHHFYSLEFEERRVALWAFMRTWEKDTFRRVAVAVIDRVSGDVTNELSVLGSVVAALGGSASLVAVSGGSHVLADTYGKYVGSGYSRKLIKYPVFDLRLLKWCLQKVSSSVFGSLDPFFMTEFIVTRLKVPEHRDWMMSHSSFRHAIITEELSMPSPVDVVSNIVGVWLLIVVYLKETGKENPRRQLCDIIDSPLLFQLQVLSQLHRAVFFSKKGNDSYFCVHQMARSKFHLFYLILEICKSSFFHIPHPVHVGTYRLRKISRKF